MVSKSHDQKIPQSSRTVIWSAAVRRQKALEIEEVACQNRSREGSSCPSVRYLLSKCSLFPLFFSIFFHIVLFVTVVRPKRAFVAMYAQHTKGRERKRHENEEVKTRTLLCASLTTRFERIHANNTPKKQKKKRVGKSHERVTRGKDLKINKRDRKKAMRVKDQKRAVEKNGGTHARRREEKNETK